jgi:hypothetical protein
VVSFRRNRAPSAAALLLAMGCYSPNISPGGFSCGPGMACPDKFHCAANGLCYQGDASIDVPVDMPPVCTSVTNITTPVCATEPSSGQDCDPTCQTGCKGCGWCAVVDGKAKCTTGTEGSGDVGDTCDPKTTNQCKAGLYCQPDCGSGGRCYKFCDPTSKTNSCGTGSSCGVTARSPGADGGLLPFSLCGLVSATCDVVGRSGCPTTPTTYACYPLTTKVNECDCPGSGNPGDPCTRAADCAPGSYCLQPSQNSPSTCHQACNSNDDCTVGTCTDMMDPFTFGFCM